MEMCIDNPREGFGELFDTHPSVDNRVAALIKFAGGHDPGPIALPPPASEADNDQTAPAGPWDSEKTGSESPVPSRSGAPAGTDPGPWSEPAPGSQPTPVPTPAITPGEVPGAMPGPWGPHRSN
jgi:heat shock protein HtpX